MTMKHIEFAAELGRRAAREKHAAVPSFMYPYGHPEEEEGNKKRSLLPGMGLLAGGAGLAGLGYGLGSGHLQSLIGAMRSPEFQQKFRNMLPNMPTFGAGPQQG